MRGWSNPYFAFRFASISGGRRRWRLKGLPGARLIMKKVTVSTRSTNGNITINLLRTNLSISLYGSPLGQLLLYRILFPVLIYPDIFVRVVVVQGRVEA